MVAPTNTKSKKRKKKERKKASFLVLLSQCLVCPLWDTVETWQCNMRDCCCVSIQGLHPLKDSAFEVSEGESFTLLITSAVVKWDGLAFRAFPGCVTRCFTLTSQFLPPRPTKVTIYATRCRHFLSYFGRAKNLGICEAVKDSSSASSKKREKKAFAGIFLQMLQS